MSMQGVLRDPRNRRHRRPDLFPNWFVASGLLLAALASLRLPGTMVFLLAVGLTLAATRDLWQALLTLTLGSLTLATTGANVDISQPYLLRFVLLTALLLLLVVRHLAPTAVRAPRSLKRGVVALAIFTGWVAITALLSVIVATSLQASLAAAVTFAVPVVAALSRWRTRELLSSDLFTITRFLWVFAAVGVGLAFAGGLFGRSSGVHANPNTFAFMCALGFGLSLGLRLLMRRGVSPIVLMTFGLGVLLTGSRGALAGCMLAVLYLVARHESRQQSRGLLVAVGAVVVTLLIAPVPGPLDLGAAFTRTFGGQELDLASRQDYWRDMQVLVAQRPITGHGLAGSEEALTTARGLGLTATAGGHNSFLTIMAETGIVGTLLLLIIVVSSLRLGPPLDETGRAVWIAASGTVVTGLGHMLGESFILGVGSPFPLIFWTSVIVLLAVGSQNRTVRHH